MKGEVRTLSVICIIVIKTIITITTTYYYFLETVYEEPHFRMANLSTYMYFKSKLSWVSMHEAEPKKLTIMHDTCTKKSVNRIYNALLDKTSRTEE